MPRTSPPLAAPLVAIALLALPVRASGQLAGDDWTGSVAGNLSLQLFSLLGDVEGTLDAPPDSPAGAGTREISAEIRAQTRLTPGLSAAWDVGPGLEIFADLRRTGTTMEVSARSVRPDGSDPRFFEVEDLGRVTVWQGGLGARVRLPRFGEITVPHVGGGLGFSHWNLANLERLPGLTEVVGEEVGVNAVEGTLLAGVLTAGIDTELRQGWTLRLEITDQVSRNPIDDDDFELGTRFEGFGRAADWVHGLRFGAGVRLALD